MQKATINGVKKRKWGVGGPAGVGVWNGLSRGWGSMRNNVKGCRMVGVGDCNRGVGINSVKKSEMGGRGGRGLV